MLQTEEQCKWGRKLVRDQLEMGELPTEIVYVDKDELKSIEANIGPDVLGGATDLFFTPDVGELAPYDIIISLTIMGSKIQSVSLLPKRGPCKSTANNEIDGHYGKRSWRKNPFKYENRWPKVFQSKL